MNYFEQTLFAIFNTRNTKKSTVSIVETSRAKKLTKNALIKSVQGQARHISDIMTLGRKCKQFRPARPPQRNMLSNSV